MVDGMDMAISMTKGAVSDAETDIHIEGGARVVELEMCYDGVVVFKLSEKPRVQGYEAR